MILELHFGLSDKAVIDVPPESQPQLLPALTKPPTHIKFGGIHYKVASVEWYGEDQRMILHLNVSEVQ